MTVLKQICNALSKRRIFPTLLVLPLAYSSIVGCSYDNYPDPPTEYVVSRTKKIFLGSLIQRTTAKRKDDGYRFLVHSLLFRIDKDLKGGNGRTHVIQYWDQIGNRDSCYEEPPHPKVGEQWVVYDDYDGGNVLHNIRNPALLSWQYNGDNRSHEELQTIERSVAFPAATFFGEVEMGFFDIWPSDEGSMKVELLSGNRDAILQTSAVQKGRFSFSNLETGWYVVRLRSAKRYGLFYPRGATMEKSSDGSNYYVDFKIEMRPALPEYLNISLADPGVVKTR